MPNNDWKSAGAFAFLDSGVPSTNRHDYPTLVMLHGLVWSAGVFSRLLPQAEKAGARVIVVNRRGYPGSKPFTDEERALLDPNPDAPDDPSKIEDFAKQIARDLHGFLVELVVTEDIPVKSIILAGWSLGSVWMLLFLAHASSFPMSSIALHRYIRRVVSYESAARLLGYSLPEKAYSPDVDETVAPEDLVAAFNRWVSGYYQHGDTFETLSQKDPVSEPRPSCLNMSSEDLAQNTYAPAADLDATDRPFMNRASQHGVLERLRKAVLFPSRETANDSWTQIEFRVTWCDRSIWMSAVATWEVEAEIAEARKSGAFMRKTSIQRVRGANHFLHWDEPQRALKLLLSDEVLDI